jgi:hypothetical protein
MTDKAILNHRGAIRFDGSYKRFEGVFRKDSRGVINDEADTDPIQTDVGNAIVHDSIVKHSSFLRRTDQGPIKMSDASVVDTRFNINGSFVDIQTDWPTGLDVSNHPDDLGSVARVSNIIVDGGNMSFIGHDGEATADLITLMLEAVSGELRSLLSDMLPATLSPEAVRVPLSHSISVPLPTTVEALSVSIIAPQRPPERPGGPPSTLEHGGGAAITTDLYGRHPRKMAGIMATFFKRLLSSVLTTKPANGGNHAMMMPPPWSARPMAFARYARPHGHGVSGVSYELEKRHHFPVTEASRKR